MSAIYGMVRYDGAPVTRETLAPIAAVLSSWGPDGHGQWCGDSAGLGHLMLHVTPESMYERLPAGIRAAPHLVITADARIDNRDEILDGLGAPGPGRSKTPDSSLILLAYKKWGPECVTRLLGDYAFAILDTRERKLFCARDPFGCKPFIYHFDGKHFLFASDVKGVLARVGSPRLNEALLAAYLQVGTCHAEKTMTFYKEVVKLPPAHSLMVTAGGLEISRYWSPEDAPEFQPASDDAYAEQLGFLFRQSVECRVRSAFPIGSHLSGGLDSCATSIAAARILRPRGRELAVFSWSPPPNPAVAANPGGEYARIDAVCRQENLFCEYLPPTTASLIETFQRDFTVEPMVMMAREASVQARAKARQLRVMLSGWGGDEAVTCRATTSPTEFLTGGRWDEFRSAVLSRLDSAGASAPAFSKALRLAGILREMTTVQLPDWLYCLAVANPYLTHKAPCVQAAFERLHRSEVKELRGPALRRLPRVRQSILRLLELGHVSLRMEHWAASGAPHCLDYRYPMLDKRLVEFVVGIPPSPLRMIDQRRSLFRRAVGDLLPESVDWNPVKTEAATMMALKREYIQAHSEWARHLAAELTESQATRFVDPAKIQKAVSAAVTTGKREALSGVREAFGFYALRF